MLKRVNIRKEKGFFKKKAYITWEDNDSCSSYSSDSYEEMNHCLMVDDDSSRSNVSVCGDNDNFDKLYNASQELFL